MEKKNYIPFFVVGLELKLLGHVEPASLPNYTFPGQVYSSVRVYVLSSETDKYPRISGRERIPVESIS